jgi:hypothetical protein
MRTQFDQDLLELLNLDRLPVGELTERERIERFRLTQAVEKYSISFIPQRKAKNKAA